MKYYTFYREDNKFDDITTDIILKKVIKEKIRWYQYLVIGISEYHKDYEKNVSYLTLKYGDEMRNNCLVTDRTPVPFKDYQPKEPRWLR